MMMKVILVIFALIYVTNAAFTVASFKEALKTKQAKRWCGDDLKKAMAFICPRIEVFKDYLPGLRGSFYKRSNSNFMPTMSMKNDGNLWRKVFNINENTTVSIPEVEFQMKLLFGHCDDNQKMQDINNLMKYYNEQEQIQYLDQLDNGNTMNFKNHGPPNDAYESFHSNYRPSYRYKRNVIYDCCDNPCTPTQLVQYCGFDE